MWVVCVETSRILTNRCIPSRGEWADIVHLRFRRLLHEAPATRIACLDAELRAIEDPRTAVTARKYRNSAVLACGLPDEVLRAVLSMVNEIWKPIAKGTSGYSLGWIYVVHVCSSWREVRVGAALFSDHASSVELPSVGWHTVYQTMVRQHPYLECPTEVRERIRRAFYGYEYEHLRRFLRKRRRKQSCFEARYGHVDTYALPSPH